MIKTSKTLKKIITNLAAHKFYIISILLFNSLQNETTRKTFYYKAPIDPQTIPPNFYSSLPQRIEHTKKNRKNRTHEKRKLFNNENRRWAGNNFFSLSLSLHTTKVFSLPRQFLLSIFSLLSARTYSFGFFAMWRSKCWCGEEACGYDFRVCYYF